MIDPVEVPFEIQQLLQKYKEVFANKVFYPPDLAVTLSL
jgi:hypothetical protein